MADTILQAGQLTLAQLRACFQAHYSISLAAADLTAVTAAAECIQSAITRDQPIYGVTTGFGKLATVTIAKADLVKLQHNLVISHATGVGTLLADETVRLIMLLKLNCLGQGFSGVRPNLLAALLHCYNQQIYPCIPSKGSVGASGDLAPLAHLSQALLGAGEVYWRGERMPAKDALYQSGIKPITLAPKEGLALLNGTQVSTALALHALFITERVFAAALLAGSLSIDAAAASQVPFDKRLHDLSGNQKQQYCARIYADLLQGSEIMQSHQPCSRIQDPYSLRCQPQVMGACLSHIVFASEQFLMAANGVSDNPLIFAAENDILSGGNFHAEAIAMAADTLALAIAEIGAMSERRIALLIDPNLSGLPAFLVAESGLNSGLMLAQVTAAAVASENKSLAHPASVDSIPTSANQEDHVSMATFAARRLLGMLDNTATILAIELIAACQGIDLRQPLTTSKALQAVQAKVRETAAFYDSDRSLSAEIEQLKTAIMQGEFSQFVPSLFSGM